MEKNFKNGGTVVPCNFNLKFSDYSFSGHSCNSGTDLKDTVFKFVFILLRVFLNNINSKDSLLSDSISCYFLPPSLPNL